MPVVFRGSKRATTQLNSSIESIEATTTPYEVVVQQKPHFPDRMLGAKAGLDAQHADLSTT